MGRGRRLLVRSGVLTKGTPAKQWVTGRTCPGIRLLRNSHSKSTIARRACGLCQGFQSLGGVFN